MTVFHVRAFKTIIDSMDIEAINEKEAELKYLQQNVGVQNIIETTNLTELWIKQGIKPEFAQTLDWKQDAKSNSEF